jgi:thioredoxin 1
VFEDLAREYLGRMKFVRLNLEGHKELAEGYGIMSTPTIKFFCTGRPVYDVIGALSREELKAILEGVLSIHQKCLVTSSPVYYV